MYFLSKKKTTGLGLGKNIDLFRITQVYHEIKDWKWVRD